MRRAKLRLGAAIAALTVATAAPGAQAISNGQLDGNGHPNVGLFAIEHDGIKEARCSGFCAGPRKADPGTGVFVTAAHCPADLAALGFSGSDLTVAPDAAVAIEEETFATTATTWHPAFASDTTAVGDHGVMLLEDPVAGLAGVEFPAAGLLDDLAAGGALKPTTLFDNVGYGLIPQFKRGPARYELTEARMLSTSKFLGLMKSDLKLLTRSTPATAAGASVTPGGASCGMTPICGAVQFCQLGEIYPFVPSAGEQQRDTEHELRLKAQIGQYLPVEPELDRWFPLWGIPV